MMIWCDGNETAEKMLNEILRTIVQGENMKMPRPCPACLNHQPTLHAYFHSRGGDKVGGVWIWCSQCAHFFHGSIRPPRWWKNLETIDVGSLTSEPTYLEQVATQIDAHWKTFKTYTTADGLADNVVTAISGRISSTAEATS
jgi:hypothetical protein